MMTALSGDAPMKMDGDGFVRRDPNRAVIGPTLGVQDAAVYAALTAVAALVRRAKTGEGCYIDVAASDAAICNNVLMTNNALNLHRVTDRDGIPKTGDAGGGAKYQYYETKDRKIVLFCAMEHRFWDAFCRVTGREDLLAEKKDKFVFDWGDGSKLRREVQKIFHSKTQAEWIELAAKHHIAIGPAYAADDFHTDPHTKARGILFDDMHPHAGPYTYFGWPARIPGQQFSVKRPAPLLGEQTEEILAEFGRSEADIARLRGAGAV
jgi:crotonobetainyl-CoA:carnitine CoA-transferase CaiB-like acyl-CoA transferase